LPPVASIYCDSERHNARQVHEEDCGGGDEVEGEVATLSIGGADEAATLDGFPACYCVIFFYFLGYLYYC
jgi:hypothetical protein